MKKILMIAFHYPPVKGSSGVHRTLSFSKYLPQHGWQPIIVSVNKRVYDSTSYDLNSQIPDSVEVYRPFALDCSKDLSIKGKYLKFLSLPDKWSSWSVSGVMTGLYIIKKYKPDLIWSTYPIATAHLIGLFLNRITNIPWIADFRDSMTEQNYPADKIIRQVYRKIEAKTIRNCLKAVFTTPGAVEMYEKRYPEINKNKFAVIENGIDEDSFLNALQDAEISDVNNKLTLVHSGILYQEERNPVPFFEAVSKMKKQGIINKNSVQFIFRASGNEMNYRQILIDMHIDDIVNLSEPVTYKEALMEMITSNGLLLFQGKSCNHQIPAKLYEYLRTGRPIIALTDKKGNTADVLTENGHFLISDMKNTTEIISVLSRFILSDKKSTLKTVENSYSLSREYRTEQLVNILNLC